MTDLLDDKTRSTLSDEEVWPARTPTGYRDALSDQDIQPMLFGFSGFRIPERGSSLTTARQRAPIALMEPLLWLSDDWDGHGALAPSVGAMKICGAFLRGVPENLCLPDVTASVDGGILLEWDSDDSDLLLSIDKNGHVTAYLRNGTTEVEGPLSSHQLAVAETLSSFVQDHR